MEYKLTKGDIELLTHIADYRILTIEQLAAIRQRAKQSIRKNVRKLENEGFVFKGKEAQGHAHRPIDFIFLTEKCLDHFDDKELTLRDITIDPMFIEHELLVNWFRIHLQQIDISVPEMKVNYLSPVFQKNDYLQMQIVEKDNNKKKIIKLIPDGVFAISKNKKSLLFFVEVDMGTEVISSQKNSSNNITQKIVNYQTLFWENRYKHYEEVFEAKLNGFRLLFLTNTRTRMIKICQLVAKMPPSNFIWLTEQEKMFNYGLSAKIWAKGGHYNNPLQSILGKLSCKAPVCSL